MKAKCSVSRLLLLTVLGGIMSTAIAQSSASDVPRLANGKPDLTGTWDNGAGIAFLRPVSEGGSVCFFGCGDAPPGAPPGAPNPDRPSYKPAVQARVADLNERQVDTDPVLRCFPPGVPRIGPPDKIVQRVDQTIFLYEDVSGSFFRIVPTNGSSHRTDAEPSYLGDAIGHWDGDTLVVETTNFNGETWLTDDGSFHTPALRVVERLTRDADTLTWLATAHDPEVLTEPWALRPRVAHLTDLEIVESPPCIERDLEHMMDNSSHDNAR